MLNNLITVIILFYKEKPFQIKRSIESIINQTYKNVEILILLDDPQNQEMINLVLNYIENDNRINFIVNEKNIGIGASRKKAVELAKGELIAFQDGDDFSYPNRIEKQFDFFLKNDTYDMIGTKFRVVDEASKRYFFVNNKKSIEDRISYSNPLLNPTIMFKKQSIIKFGNFDEKIRFAEDQDLMIRWFLQGAKFYEIDEVLVDYYRDISGNNANYRKEVIGGLKVLLKYRKQLKIGIKRYLISFFYEIPIFALLPRRLVSYLMFKKNFSKK